MNRMACPEAWAAMKACFVFMSSPPIERKKPRLCVEPQPPPPAACYPGEAAPVQRPRLLRRGRRGRARGLKLEPPGLQLRWRDAELGSHTAMRRTRLRQPGNRLVLVFRRKSPPRLLCHLVPPGRYSIYRLVRDPGATSYGISEPSQEQTEPTYQQPNSNGIENALYHVVTTKLNEKLSGCSGDRETGHPSTPSPHTGGNSDASAIGSFLRHARSLWITSGTVNRSL